MTRKTLGLAIIATITITACGMENLFGTLGRGESARPASTLQGFFPNQGLKTSEFNLTDGGGTTVVPFDTRKSSDTYEVRFPSSKYSMVRLHARAGEMELRAIVPTLLEESTVGGVDLDAKNMTEALIVEARLSADGVSFKKLTPSAYLGTRQLILAAMDVPGPTQDLYHMVQQLLPAANPDVSVTDPSLFVTPEFTKDAQGNYQRKTSAIDPSWIVRHPIDYAQTGVEQNDSQLFDAKLAEVAKNAPDPSGCPDPKHVRLVFSVDFNQGSLNGNGGTIDRFKWAKDKPGKQMFFVGWIHLESAWQDKPATPDSPATTVNKMLGASTPNIIKMYDDGTNGDEVAGDNIWTVTFDVPTDPDKVLRVGYKYTWGTQGSPWTGSEEWPGNSRILEVLDVNGDGFVHRRDVFGDEATNKDKANGSLTGTGTITWTTELRPGCGPESHEQKSTLHNASKCDEWLTPQSIGPIKVACTQ